MRFVLISGMIVLLLSSFCTAGQYYKFVDENGVIGFTDDLSKIPKEQRPEVEETQEIKTVSEKQADTEEKTTIAPASPEKDTRTLEAEAAALEAIKKNLDRAYEALHKENLRLLEMKNTLTDLESINLYNNAVSSLNEKTRAYQEQQAEYIKRANAYNAAVDQTPEKKNQPLE